MASTKERQRWDEWYTKVMARIEQQKKSITRLVLINTEALAALAEIVDTNCDGSQCGVRAQAALDRIEEIAAAVRQSVEESDSDPIPDPRSNK